MTNDYRPTLLAVGWTLAALATIAVACRIYCRTVLTNRRGWEDVIMGFAWAGAIATTVLVTLSTRYGFGLHFDEIENPVKQSLATKYTLIPPAISLLSAGAAKISIVMFLVRILGSSVEISYKLVLYIPSIIMIGANVFAMVVLLGYCTPPEKAWIPSIPGHCMSAATLDIGGRAVTVYNAAMDLLCAIFPVFMVWRLNMKTRTKWGLAIVMSGGIVGAIASIVKVVMMSNIKNTADITYSWAPIAIWYMVEHTNGRIQMFAIIIAGSIPTLRPLWKVIRGLQSTSESNISSSDRYNKRFQRPSTGNSSAGAGLYTMALRELDKEPSDLDLNGPTSSRERIL
ncbi:hypothetical protein UA08_05540 [Talaromyces atroroseus]|uniref:Rhodopsin domain-containing protein n=1 Tax=Talaromyces atroroseus TaxID=1441469 RepID=A0A225AD07_TALAT|nr:hypothetical protein UA08_05540 [Talaromyces atroroseus]OKL59022.1 hypothetical protein UA08_05540 [Talaromyces atroroseus]